MLSYELEKSEKILSKSQIDCTSSDFAERAIVNEVSRKKTNTKLFNKHNNFTGRVSPSCTSRGLEDDLKTSGAA
jgi:hypothetical protein